MHVAFLSILCYYGRMAERKKHPGGRPTKYNAKLHIPLAEAYGRLGMTDVEIAEKLNISKATLNNWKTTHPEFLDSLNYGKEHKDDLVENALLRRALGYSQEEEHITSYLGCVTKTKVTKKFPPDPTSMIFWLKNRQPKKWRDKQDIALSNSDPNQPLRFEVVDPHDTDK